MTIVLNTNPLPLCHVRISYYPMFPPRSSSPHYNTRLPHMAGCLSTRQHTCLHCRMIFLPALISYHQPILPHKCHRLSKTSYHCLLSYPQQFGLHISTHLDISNCLINDINHFSIFPNKRTHPPRITYHTRVSAPIDSSIL